MSQKLGFSRISRMEESSVLTEFVDRMIRITDELVDQIKTGQLDGEFHFHQDSVHASAAGEPVSLDLLCEMLYERPEISGVELCGDEVYVTVAPEYAVHEDDSRLRSLTQTEVDIICALHTLWLNNAGGEQADFTDCLLKDINLTSRNLNYAVCLGEGYNGEYDPKNPEDELLLRFDVAVRDEDIGDFVTTESRCTCFAAKAPIKDKEAALDVLLDHFHHAYTSQPRHCMSSLADRLKLLDWRNPNWEPSTPLFTMVIIKTDSA